MSVEQHNQNQVLTRRGMLKASLLVPPLFAAAASPVLAELLPKTATVISAADFQHAAEAAQAIIKTKTESLQQPGLNLLELGELLEAGTGATGGSEGLAVTVPSWLPDIQQLESPSTEQQIALKAYQICLASTLTGQPVSAGDNLIGHITKPTGERIAIRTEPKKQDPTKIVPRVGSEDEICVIASSLNESLEEWSLVSVTRRSGTETFLNIGFMSSQYIPQAVRQKVPFFDPKSGIVEALVKIFNSPPPSDKLPSQAKEPVNLPSREELKRLPLKELVRPTNTRLAAHFSSHTLNRLGDTIKSFPPESLPNHLSLLIQHFDELQAQSLNMRNSTNGLDLRPDDGSTDFTLFDAADKFCARFGLGHNEFHLFWGKRDFVPRWMLDLFGADLRKKALEHVDLVVPHLAGRVKKLSVFNELEGDAYVNPGSNPDDPGFWLVKIGNQREQDDFMVEVLERIKSHDPRISTGINDYAIEIPDTWYNPGRKQRAYNRAARLMQRGARLDWVGLQNHQNGWNFINPARRTQLFSGFAANVRELQALGLEVYPSEVSFDMGAELARTNNVSSANFAKAETLQGSIYRDFTAKCLELGLSIGLWGLCDPRDDSRSFLFDTNGNPKPAFDGFQDAIVDHILKNPQLAEKFKPPTTTI